MPVCGPMMEKNQFVGILSSYFISWELWKKKKQKERKGTHTGLKSVVHQSVSGGPDSLISLQKHTFIPLLTYSTETGSYFMEKVFPLWESGSFLMDSSTRCQSSV